MIDRAAARTRSAEDRAGLAELKEQVARYDGLQTAFDRVVERANAAIDAAQSIARDRLKSLSGRARPAPRLRPQPPSGPASALTKFKALGRAISEYAGGGPSEGLGSGMVSFLTGLAGRGVQHAQVVAAHLAGAKSRKGGRPPSKPSSSSPTRRPAPTAPKDYAPMTETARGAILVKARALRDLKGIKYSKTERNGPDSYDCSGFVSAVYGEAGLELGSANVEALMQLAGTGGPLEEIPFDQARPGDIVVWLAGDNPGTSDHTGIYAGQQTIGPRTGPSVIHSSSSASDNGKNAIQQTLIEYMIKKKSPEDAVFRVLHWKKRG